MTDANSEAKVEANVCAKCSAVIEDYDGVSFCYGELPSTSESVQRCPAVFCSACSSQSFVCCNSSFHVFVFCSLCCLTRIAML